MPRSIVPLANNVNLQLGTTSYGPVLIGDDIRWIRMSYSVDDFTNPASLLDVTIEMSVDGGPFMLWKRFTAHGMPVQDRRVTTVLSGGAPFPGVNRQARVIAILTGSRFRSTVTVNLEVTDGVF